MSVEEIVRASLRTLTSDRVYPDIAPVGTKRPYITYQQVGGVPVNFLEATPPGTRNARMQVNCWAGSRVDASALAQEVSTALMTTLRAFVLDETSAIYVEDLQLYGTQQDFSIWY